MTRFPRCEQPPYAAEIYPRGGKPHQYRISLECDRVPLGAATVEWGVLTTFEITSQRDRKQAALALLAAIDFYKTWGLYPDYKIADQAERRIKQLTT